MSQHDLNPYEGNKKREKQRCLEREVLHALRAQKQGLSWDILYAAFETTGDIATVLKELKDGYQIAVDSKQNVTITTIGQKRLAAGMF
jgi:hypothetical protein